MKARIILTIALCMLHLTSLRALAAIKTDVQLKTSQFTEHRMVAKPQLKLERKNIRKSLKNWRKSQGKGSGFFFFFVLPFSIILGIVRLVSGSGKALSLLLMNSLLVYAAILILAIALFYLGLNNVQWC